MIWKPKEKELTPEEAVALAKKELTPYWLGSSPLIAGVKNGDRSLVVPLDPDFPKKSWLMLFADPTEFSGETSLFFLKEWHRRYESHGLNALAIYVPPYDFLKHPDVIQKLRDKHEIDFPVVMDADESIAAAFGATQLPRILLYDQGQIFLQKHGEDWLTDTELNIQRFLRSSDPGLPLLVVFEPTEKREIVKDTLRIELGSQSAKRGQRALFSTDPHFDPSRPEAMTTGGAWQLESERITTSDPSAFISFKSQFSMISLIAQSASKIAEPGIISVEINGEPLHGMAAGEHITQDESGRSVVKVKHSLLYHLMVRRDPGPMIEMTLRFPQANHSPVFLYGLRFGA